jgi:protein-S-isoprenylcysteine O-methyltransferase Ste14
MVKETASENSSAIRPASPAVQSRLPIHHIRHVPALLTEELHDLLARACHLRPTGFGLRVLFQPSNLVPLEHEVHLPQTALGSAPDREAARSHLDGFGILDEGLPPDFDEGLLEGECHGTCLRLCCAVVLLVAAALAVARPIAYRDSIPLSVKRTRTESREPHKMTLKTKLALRFLIAAAAIGAILFIPAGSLRFWQGWVYQTISFVPGLVAFLYFYKHDPELVERRLRQREKVREQKILMGLLRGTVAALFVLPGLDHRFGWSHLPLWLTLLSQTFVLGGWLMMYWVMKVNRFAASTIEVEPGQRVISTGPYGVVRHPMYLGAGVMFLFSPLALGSYFALPAFAPVILILVFRLLNEEKVLRQELPGYSEYCLRTRFRLVPLLW